MGRIADRMARRGDARHALVRRLVLLAAAAFTGDESADDALMDLLEAQCSSDPAEFESLLEAAFDEIVPRRDAQEVGGWLDACVESIIEEFETEAGFHQLAALPVLVSHLRPAWELRLSSEQCEAIAQELRNSAMVCESARVNVCPALVSPRRAEQMLAGEAYRLGRALARGDTALAMEQFGSDEGQTYRVGIEDPAGPVNSLALVVFTVSSPDPESLPLAMETRYAEQEAEALNDEAALGEAYDELMQALAPSQAVLASILQATSVSLMREPHGWTADVDTACRYERAVQTSCHLREVAAQLGTELSALAVRIEERPASEEFAIVVCRHDDQAEIAEVPWPSLFTETGDECLDSLRGFLASEGIAAADEPGGGEDDDAAPDARVRMPRRVLH